MSAGSAATSAGRPWTRASAEVASGTAVRVGAWPATLAVAGFAAAVYLAFVAYGFNLDDEGTVLYQILRTYRGQRPYLDFHTGYTPAVFYLNAALFRLFGVSVLPIRLLLVAVNTLATALVFRLALRLAPAAESACAALAYALYMPFFAGQFAAFNIPYPAWYAAAAWLGAQLASTKAVERRSRAWLGAAGALAGVAFSFKPNTGVMALGAAVLVQLLASAPIAGALGAVLETTVLVVAFLGVIATLGFDVIAMQFLLLGVPILVLLAGAIGLRLRARRKAAPGVCRTLGAGLLDAGAILAGFLAMNAAWMAYFLPRMGLAGFGRDILLLGAGVERIYRLYVPEPSLWTGVTLVLLAGGLALPRAIRSGRIGRRGLTVGAALGAAGLAVAAWRLAVAPEGFAVSVVLQLENVSFYAFPLIFIVVVLRWIDLQRRSDPLARGALPRALEEWTAALVYGLFLFLQLFPRIDFMHVVISMPSALVVAAGALYRAERYWVSELGFDLRAAAGRRALRVARTAAAGVIAAALVARCLPMIDARVRLTPALGLRRMTPLGRGAMPVALERDRDHDLRELRAVAAFVARETTPRDTIVAFPALGIVPFLTDRATPVPHDYFYSGRPSHADEAAMLDQIEAARPALIVTLNDRMGYFAASPAYYFLLRDYAQREYELVRRIGRFDILMRRDLVAARPGLRRPTDLGRRFATSFTRGDYRETVRRTRRIARHGGVDDLDELVPQLADVDRLVRGRAIAAMTAVAAREPGGLDAVAARIAPDRRTRLLVLRGLGEFGDASALPFLSRQFLAGDYRTHVEASTAVNYILVRELSSRSSLSEKPDGHPWVIPPAILSDEMVARIDEIMERQRIGPLAGLAMAAGDRGDLADRLVHFTDRRDGTWYRMVAAYSLHELGRPDGLDRLFGTVNDDLLAEQYVPSMLLDPKVVDPAAARALLAARARSEIAGERELVAWMAPYLVPGEPAIPLDELRRDPVPEVRRAADWAAQRHGGRGTAPRAAEGAEPAPPGAEGGPH